MKRERQNRIVSVVNRNSSVSVKDLSVELGVSEVTVRRDLQELEREGLIRRAFGVAYSGSRTERSHHKGMESPSGKAEIHPDLWIVRSPEPTSYRIYKPLKDIDVNRVTGWNYASAGEICAYLQVNNYRAAHELCDAVGEQHTELVSGARNILVLTSDENLFEDRILGFTRCLEEFGGSAEDLHIVSQCTGASVAGDALKTYPTIELIYSADETSTLSLVEALEFAETSEQPPVTAVFGITDERIRRAIIDDSLFTPAVAVEVPSEWTAAKLLATAEAIVTAGALNTPHEYLEHRVACNPTDQRDETARSQIEPADASGSPSICLAHVRDETAESGWTLEVDNALHRAVSGSNIMLRSFDQESVHAKQIEEARISIAKRASRLVNPHQVILMNDGDINEYFAECLANSGIEVTVITNSTRVFGKLAETSSIHLISTGGELRRPHSGLVGWIAEGAVNEFRADNLFLEPETISPDYKLGCSNIAESPMMQAMIRAARRVTVLCDRFRFKTGSVTHIGPIEVATSVVTDPGTPAAVRLSIRERGIEVIT